MRIFRRGGGGDGKRNGRLIGVAMMLASITVHAVFHPPRKEAKGNSSPSRDMEYRLTSHVRIHWCSKSKVSKTL